MSVGYRVATGVAALLAITTLLATAPAYAQSAPLTGQWSTTPPSALSAQRRLRVRGTPLRVYRQTLSPTAVRACQDWYELEYRPSGTVLVPRMRCHWVDG